MPVIIRTARTCYWRALARDREGRLIWRGPVRETLPEAVKDRPDDVGQMARRILTNIQVSPSQFPDDCFFEDYQGQN